MKLCELYYPATDCFSAFPPLTTSRENASVCVVTNNSAVDD